MAVERKPLAKGVNSLSPLTALSSAKLPQSSARAGLSGAVCHSNRRRPRLTDDFRRSSAVFRLWDRCFMELQISWSPKLTATLPPDLRQLPLVAPTANGINAHTRRAK